MANTVTSSHDSLLIQELCPGIIRFRFARTPGWQNAHTNGAVREILSAMKDDGAFSVVQVAHAQTQTISPSEGVATSLDLLKNHKGPLIAVNGGFFIHLTKLFRSKDGSLLSDDKLNFTVGPSSATEGSGRFVDIHQAYAEHLKKREMTDKSYFYTGPSLGHPLVVDPLDFDKINTIAGRFQYFALDHENNKIPSPVWATLTAWDQQYKLMEDPDFTAATTMRRDTEDAWQESAMKKKAYEESGTLQYGTVPPANRFVKSLWAQIPGTLSHVTQPNERSGVSRHEGAWLFFAYNSKREHGLTMNEFGTLAKKAVSLLQHSIASDDDIWANDGGPSIFQLFVAADGATKLLAQGGLPTQSANLTLDPSKMRKVPNAIVAIPGQMEEEA